MSSENINALNQIIEMIDRKAAEFKDAAYGMPASRRAAQKKLIFDLIEDATRLIKQINPEPVDILRDLQELSRQLDRIS